MGHQQKKNRRIVIKILVYRISAVQPGEKLDTDEIEIVSSKNLK